MNDSGRWTEVFYRGVWLPCRVLEVKHAAEAMLVRVTDRTGTHEVWRHPEQVRGYVRASDQGREAMSSQPWVSGAAEAAQKDQLPHSAATAGASAYRF